MKKVAVVGAGASGLISAILVASRGIAVELFEANDRIGKKILASGNGHCNISNKNISLDHYAGYEPGFAAYALERLSFKELERLFKQWGMFLDTKADGKAYPFSYEARSVVQLLQETLQSKGVKLHLNTKIEKIVKENAFSLYSEADSFTGFDALIMAAGSEAAPQLGGNRSGIGMVEALGHSCAPTYPALVQLQLEGESFTKMTGVRQQAAVQLIIDGQRGGKIEDDLLFTRYGVSGLSVLDLSCEASYALSLFQEVQIEVNLLPKFDRQHLSSKIDTLCRQAPDLMFSTLLSGMIHSKIAIQALKESGLSTELKGCDVDMKVIQRLVSQLLGWRFVVKDTHGFKHAEVSGGGIVTSEIDPQTMMSKKVDGLYCVGELLDIVGDRGGYNFHFAWASGKVAAESIIKHFSS